MQRPHKQKWTYRGLSGCVTDEEGNDVSSPDAPDEALRFIAAAPDMARALLEFVEAQEDVAITRRRAREALEKAGVLP